MKRTVKVVTSALAIMCTIAFAKSANASWASEAVEEAVLQDSRRILPDTDQYSQPAQTLFQNSSQFQIAQTSAGSCIVATPKGTPLNVQETPGGKKNVGSLSNGTRVALGVTDGSEGRNWTRIIAPIEGYVLSAYLKNCRYKQ